MFHVHLHFILKSDGSLFHDAQIKLDSSWVPLVEVGGRLSDELKSQGGFAKTLQNKMTDLETKLLRHYEVIAAKMTCEKQNGELHLQQQIHLYDATRAVAIMKETDPELAWGQDEYIKLDDDGRYDFHADFRRVYESMNQDEKGATFQLVLHLEAPKILSSNGQMISEHVVEWKIDKATPQQSLWIAKLGVEA